MAKRFHFRLESLLHLRASLEKEAERSLARAVQEEYVLERQIEAIATARTESFESRRSEAGRYVDVQAWRDVERHLVSLERKEHQARADLKLAQGRTEACREALRRAHRDRLSLERLKERRKLEHDTDQDRLEAAQLDELAVMRFRRRLA
ncbi:MAG TPA: flagellar export protein FliJ [Holophagaceae bacterium]|nr:flagellar export protein FliJ [Holophagaceae bacterium]